MIDYADVVYGLAWGDEGKGKISNSIANRYDYVCLVGSSMHRH